MLINAKRALPFLLLILMGGFFTILSACGFHLHDKNFLPTQIRSLYLQTDTPYSAFTQQLKLTLRGNGATLVSKRNAAPITLAILSEGQSQQLLGSSATNQLSIVTLTYTISYQLLARNGRPISSPRPISAQRNQTIASSQMLGASNEQALVLQELYRDVTDQLLNQLSSENTIETLQKPA